MKNLIKSILITLICLFFISTLHAQQVIREGTFNMDNRSYEISKSSYRPVYLIRNTVQSELSPNPLEANGIPTEIILTGMKNEEELQKIVFEILGEETRGQLVAAKEKVTGWIYYRADGKVIRMVFSVQENTVLSLDDLARVEGTLQERFKASFESNPPDFHQYLYYIRKNYEWDLSNPIYTRTI